MIEAYFNIFAIFAMMFVGYFLSYKKWFDSHTADVFSKMVLALALPFEMFITITQKFSKAEFIHLIGGIVVPVLSMIIAYWASKAVAKLLGVKSSRLGTFSTMFTCSNTIFIGLPINIAVFGSASIPYVLIYYIANTTFFWTWGVYKIAQDSQTFAGLEEAPVPQSFGLLAGLKKVMNPAMLGFTIGIIWLLIGIKVPLALGNFATYIGNLTTPLSMFIIGITVYFLGIRTLKLNKAIVGVLMGRFIISPLIIVVLTRFIHIPDLMVKVFFIQSSMPIQNSVPILARLYHADVEFATSTLGYTVLSYLAVVPVLLAVLQWL
ncbi:AEC family transporter [Lactococcus insecticola]|uniref:Malate transporter n=1 Tax=Pseudolactococcus insecticola TaxID=2709158 RepID=A0A6A0BA27_9LACT|nr:AEC family transporter [Lactococcus insecticola]GFH41311.1 malate transporter [Lactococcus insecticola]